MNWPDIVVAVLVVMNTLIMVRYGRSGQRVASQAVAEAHAAKELADEVRRQTKRENLVRALRNAGYMNRKTKGTK